MIINNLSETKKYGIVYVDPPWKKKKGGLRKSRPNQTRDLDYKTLSNDEIKNIISKIQVEEKHNFFVWTVDEFLFDCENMRGKQTTVFREKATKHSKKPEIAYEILEELFPETKKIEIFARNERVNWDSYGNELGEIGGEND